MLPPPRTPTLPAAADALLPRVHVVGPARGAVSTALTEAITAHARLLVWERPPAPAAIGLNELVIVDLTAAHDVVEPRSVTALLDRAEVWLVVGPSIRDGSIAPVTLGCGLFR